MRFALPCFQAVVPVHSIDKNADWVLIRAQDKNTDKNGKVDSIELQEIWHVDKKGKLDRIFQYALLPHPAKK